VSLIYGVAGPICGPTVPCSQITLNLKDTKNLFIHIKYRPNLQNGAFVHRYNIVAGLLQKYINILFLKTSTIIASIAEAGKLFHILKVDKECR